MPDNPERKPVLRITDRWQFQFDELDETLLALKTLV